jgi:hypothetical protein
LLKIQIVSEIFTKIACNGWANSYTTVGWEVEYNRALGCVTRKLFTGGVTCVVGRGVSVPTGDRERRGWRTVTGEF